MASLTGQNIKDTYQSLLKTADNGLITNVSKNITDGSGSASGLYLKNNGILISGSLLVTGSVDITGSLTVNTVNVGQNTLNFIDDNGSIINSLSIQNGSNNILISTGSIQASSGSYFSGSFTGSLEGTASFSTTSSYALTASYALNGGGGGSVDTGSLLVTASVSSNTITFTKGDASTFNITVETGSSAVSIDTGSFATTGSNTFIGTQTISGSIILENSSSIQSIPNSSGDALGASTLELKPDTSLGTDQYIVLDPTAPSHIHIRAGGIIDASSAYLYLGGENNNVRVSDYGSVEISATNTITAKTGSNEVGLKLDFANEEYSLGDSGSVGNGNKLIIDNLGGIVTLSGNNNNQGVQISHAMSGRKTTIGDYSDTNSSTKIIVDDSSQTISATGSFVISGSLAQGDVVTATGSYSHAEGHQTIASGSYSHAEGGATQAIGGASHAEGASTQAIGESSHAEGTSTHAIGSHSHAEGASTQAIGAGSHAEGENTKAVGESSHAEGQYTQTGTQNAYYAQSVVNGVVTLSASYSNVSSSISANSRLYLYDQPFDNQYEIGAVFLISQSYFDSTNTIIELYDTNVNTTTAYVLDINQPVANWLGDQTIPGNYSHTEGENTRTINNNRAHAEGYQSVASGYYSHAEGGYNDLVTSDSILGGRSIGLGSHAEGGLTQAVGKISHAEGGHTQALGRASHAEGSGSQAIGTGSHAEGYQTIASGSYQHVSGQYNQHNNDTSYFVVGIGLSEGTRKDGFTVDVDANGSGSVMIPNNVDAPSIAKTGSMYVDPINNKLWIYTGNGGVSGWVTASLG